MVFIMLISVFSSAIIASADDWPAPRPFYVISADETRIFHVNPENSPDAPATGLYYNTTPLELIYLVEMPCQFLWESDFFFSKDLQYFAWVPQMNIYRTTLANATAVMFFGNGVLLRRYRVTSLVEDLNKVSQSTTMADWIRYGLNRRRSIKLDSRRNQLTIRTTDNLTYVFDMTTGAILEGDDLIQNTRLQYILFLAVSTSIAVVILLLAKGKRSSGVVSSKKSSKVKKS